MVYSKLYQLDTSDSEWQVAHLFEHLVIHKFYSMLASKGVHSEMIAWVNGKTFENTVFVDTLFYTRVLADQFDTFVTNLPSFSDDEIAYGIATLQAEDKIILTVNNVLALQSELAKLSKRDWNTRKLLKHGSSKQTILTEKQSAKDFRDIIIISKATNLTVTEQKVFLRLTILLMDVVTDSLSTIPGIYRGNDSDIVAQDKDMAFMTQYTITKGTALKQIQDAVSSATTVDDDHTKGVIDCHFKTFSAEPLWQGAPIEYFRQTGIITTNQEIAKLATFNVVKSILQKSSLEVQRMTSAHKSYFK